MEEGTKQYEKLQKDLMGSKVGQTSLISKLQNWEETRLT